MAIPRLSGEFYVSRQREVVVLAKMVTLLSVVTFTTGIFDEVNGFYRSFDNKNRSFLTAIRNLYLDTLYIMR